MTERARTGTIIESFILKTEDREAVGRLLEGLYTHACKYVDLCSPLLWELVRRYRVARTSTLDTRLYVPWASKDTAQASSLLLLSV